MGAGLSGRAAGRERGAVYPKGLGTNSISDVTIYLGGNCSEFTSTVGNDADATETGPHPSSPAPADERRPPGPAAHAHVRPARTGHQRTMTRDRGPHRS
ncbi:NPCBM/NEW2 domain-containing protein [Streptomyces sp. NBC_00669]|uniref:NPCBM/NEW2 domain-containing protein n=1 Tax=Streptomyces sp. NBC_00669 TaxID=2976011 RepID=UPI003FA6B7DA